jgi:peptidoglycan hydrolase-like protein with peptidoglycan-binding domain
MESGQIFLNPKDKNDAMIIQKRLSELGFYTKAIDGIFGKGSRAALAQLKNSMGLDNNENWDLKTQQALFSGTGQ